MQWNWWPGQKFSGRLYISANEARKTVEVGRRGRKAEERSSSSSLEACKVYDTGWDDIYDIFEIGIRGEYLSRMIEFLNRDVDTTTWWGINVLMRRSSDRVLNNKDSNRSNWAIEQLFIQFEFWIIMVEFQWTTSMDVRDSMEIWKKIIKIWMVAIELWAIE